MNLLKPKSFRLSKGFWHEFAPNTELLFSPQNIKIEIWDLAQKKILDRWHPQVFCVSHCVFDPSGKRFALTSGCSYDKSEITIFDAEKREQIFQFSLNEKFRNAAFGADISTLYFSTHNGNLYELSFDNEERLSLLLQMEKVMFMQTKIDAQRQNLFLIACSLRNENHLLNDFILIYNTKNKSQTEIKLPEGKGQNIGSVEYFEGKLAILTKEHAGKNSDDVDIYNAKIYIYDLQKEDYIFVSDNFEMKSIHSDTQVLSWSKNGLLAAIGLNEIYLLDGKNNFSVAKIETPLPTAVKFSERGDLLAIGGEKAKILLMDNLENVIN